MYLANPVCLLVGKRELDPREGTRIDVLDQNARYSCIYERLGSGTVAAATADMPSGLRPQRQTWLREPKERVTGTVMAS